MQLGKTIQLITKPDGGIIKHLVKLRESKSYREKTFRCVVHSDIRLLNELVYHSSFNQAALENVTDQHTIPKKIAFYSNGDQDEIQQLVLQLPKTHQFVCFTNDSFLKKVTGLQNVDVKNCFVVELAKPPERPILLSSEINEKIEKGKQEEGDDFRAKFRQDPPPSFVVVNKLQDPGNVGNLLRCCVGFGFKHVYFVDDSVDEFNEKVLRASRGALLLRDKDKRAVLSYECGPISRIFDISEEYKMPIYVSDTQKDLSLSMDDIPKEEITSTKKIIVLNNESAGLNDSDRDRLEAVNSKFIHIPMATYCKSLNVASAAAVMLYTLRDNNNVHCKE